MCPIAPRQRLKAAQQRKPVSRSARPALTKQPILNSTQRLKDSIKAIGGLNYRFAFKGENLIGKGYVHDPSRGIGLDLTYEDEDSKSAWQARVVDGAALVRISVNDKPVAGGGKWLKLDQDKARTSDLMAYIADPDGDLPGGDRQQGS